MGKEILTFGEIEIENKLFFYRNKSPVNLTRFLLVKKTRNTLLVTCIMIIKLNHYI